MCTDRPVARRQRGLTLVELIIFIVIVGAGIAGILTVMNVVVKASADPMVRKQSLAFAEAILEEVLAKDYVVNSGYDTTIAANCNAPDRALADDISDYACFDGSTAGKTIAGSETLGASSVPGLENYSATVAVADEVVGALTMKKVTVTASGGPETIVLTGYRGNY